MNERINEFMNWRRPARNAAFMAQIYRGKNRELITNN